MLIVLLIISLLVMIVIPGIEDCFCKLYYLAYVF